jgi:hypothetical protein
VAWSQLELTVGDDPTVVDLPRRSGLDDRAWAQALEEAEPVMVREGEQGDDSR